MFSEIFVIVKCKWELKMTAGLFSWVVISMCCEMGRWGEAVRAEGRGDVRGAAGGAGAWRRGTRSGDSRGS